MSLRRAWPWTVLALILIGTAAIRIRLLDVPLDRDEGEYAWIGSLILDGVPPYAGVYHGKMPGTWLVYALGLAAFGRTIAAVHLLVTVTNALAIALVFRLAARLFDHRVGLAAAAIFAIASLNPQIHGLAGYAEHFVLVAGLAATLMLIAAMGRPRAWRFVLTGALFGIAFVLKQSGGLLGLIAVGAVAAETVTRRWPLRAGLGALVTMALGFGAPFTLVLLWLARAGALDEFWFWTFQYASTYATLQSRAAGARMLDATVRDILPGAWPIVALMLPGVVSLARKDSARVLMVLMFAASGAAVSAGFYFRHQYFLLLLPFVALLAGLGALGVARLAPGATPRAVIATSLVVVPVAWQLAWEANVFFRATPTQASRAIYGRNPFPESVEIARYIRAHTSDRDRIAVLGSEPQIYFYAGRRAATGYVYMYPLTESHPFAARMQEHLIREVEAARPSHLVYVNLRASWLGTAASEPLLQRWFERYIRQYERVAVADIVTRDFTRYCWAEAGQDCAPASPVWIAVYRRRE